jgi:tetratricopeptide (TPR) repeat protein
MVNEMKSLPDLSSVTLCAIDCINPLLALRSLDLCSLQCRFGEVLFLSDTASRHKLAGCRMKDIDRIGSVAEYSRFVIKELGRYCRTEYLLMVQWDGYVINPQSWRPAFLDYDYIGAPWGWYQDAHRVGNGGFSLRSRRLLDALLDEEIVNLVPEDEAIGRRYRTLLESKYGIRFAPEEIAEAFSYETIIPKDRPFGFHGLFNMWTVLPQQGLAEFVSALAPSSVASLQYLQLCKNYAELGCREEAVVMLNRRLALVRDDSEAEKLLASLLSPQFGIPPAPQIPGRNDSCSCGSGKRYKQCCGAIADTGAASSAKMETTVNLLQNAMAHHHAGRLTEAEAGYRKILDREPKNAVVLQYLGFLIMQRGDLPGGEKLIRLALDIRAFIVDFHIHLGHCLRMQGRLKEAQDCYSNVRAIRPDIVPENSYPGSVSQAAGKADEDVTDSS